jgi:hypothetical protein
MNHAIYIFSRDAGLAGLTGAIAPKPIVLSKEFLYSHGIPAPLGAGLLNKVHHPSRFIPVALLTVTSIDAHHLAEKLTPRAVLSLRQHIHFFGNRGWDRETESFGCPAHF